MHNTPALAHQGSTAGLSTICRTPAHLRRAVKSIASLQMGVCEVTIPHKQAGLLSWMDEYLQSTPDWGSQYDHLQDGHLHGHKLTAWFLNALHEAGSTVAGNRHAVGSWRRRPSHCCAAVLIGHSALVTGQSHRGTRAEDLAASLSKYQPADISVITMGNHPWQPCCRTRISWSRPPQLGCSPRSPAPPTTALSSRHTGLRYRLSSAAGLRFLQAPSGRGPARSMGWACFHQGAKAFDSGPHRISLALIRARLLEAVTEQSDACAPHRKSETRQWH